VLGERIAACVVTRTGAALDLDSLKALVREKGLAAWHQPELLVPLNELPRNAGGKIDKNSLSRTRHRGFQDGGRACRDSMTRESSGRGPLAGV